MYVQFHSTYRQSPIGTPFYSTTAAVRLTVTPGLFAILAEENFQILPDLCRSYPFWTLKLTLIKSSPASVLISARIPPKKVVRPSVCLWPFCPLEFLGERQRAGNFWIFEIFEIDRAQRGRGRVCCERSEQERSLSTERSEGAREERQPTERSEGARGKKGS